MTNHHTEEQEPTLKTLLERIDQLEQRLAPEPPPSLNDLLREQANEHRSRNTLTGTINNTRKEGAS